MVCMRFPRDRVVFRSLGSPEGRREMRGHQWMACGRGPSVQGTLAAARSNVFGLALIVVNRDEARRLQSALSCGAPPASGLPMNATREVFSFADCRVDRIRHQLHRGGKPVAIGARALDVLIALVERRDRVVSASELFDVVWPGRVIEDNNLRVHVSALRKALGAETIVTIPGRGYRFAQQLSEPVTPPSAVVVPTRSDPCARGTDLVGRDADVEALSHRLGEHRLVTIVGAGGIGKTCLARAIAARPGAPDAQIERQ